MHLEGQKPESLLYLAPPRGSHKTVVAVAYRTHGWPIVTEVSNFPQVEMICEDSPLDSVTY
jgi:hypothetical protein